MHPFPHTYIATASGEPAGSVTVESAGLEALSTTPPAQFGGPGDRWSPETLLVAALADCFVLTFRAVSRAARFEWLQLECRVQGVLERLEGVSQFSHYTTHATLTVRSGTDGVKARELLEKAEKTCLISNSLRGVHQLEADIRSAHAAIELPAARPSLEPG